MARKEIASKYIRRSLLVRVGKQIRLLRKQRRMSLEALAESAHCHPKFLQKLETSSPEIINISTSTLCDLAYSLGLKLYEFFKLVEEKDK